MCCKITTHLKHIILFFVFLHKRCKHKSYFMHFSIHFAQIVNNRATPLPWTKAECGKRYYVLCQSQHTPPQHAIDIGCRYSTIWPLNCYNVSRHRNILITQKINCRDWYTNCLWDPKLVASETPQGVASTDKNCKVPNPIVVCISYIPKYLQITLDNSIALW